MFVVRNIFTQLILLFTVVPLIELYILFRIAQLTSWLWTFILVISTGLAGAWLVKKEGRGILSRIKIELSEGRLPGEELLNGLCVLIGGALLLTPGVVTDVLGFTLVLPGSREFYKRYLKSKFSRFIKGASMDMYFR